ncbi:MAG: hypothetical protein D6820_18870, partial [Lentisphaerae bacterium]
MKDKETSSSSQAPSSNPERTERYHAPITQSFSIPEEVIEDPFAEDQKTEKFEMPSPSSSEREPDSGEETENVEDGKPAGESVAGDEAPEEPEVPRTLRGKLLLLAVIVFCPCLAFLLDRVTFIPAMIASLFFGGALLGIFRGLRTNRLYF